jgi:hypothetical protein
MAPYVEPPRCPRCTSPVVEIRIAHGNSTLTMRSCATCDTRQWHADGQTTELDSVLSHVAATKK